MGTKWGEWIVVWSLRRASQLAQPDNKLSKSLMNEFNNTVREKDELWGASPSRGKFTAMSMPPARGRAITDHSFRTCSNLLGYIVRRGRDS